MSDAANSGLGLIYREVRCARNHQRPLFLLCSIAIQPGSDRPKFYIQERIGIIFTLIGFYLPQVA